MLDHRIDLDEPGVCECVGGRQGVRAIHLPQQVGDGPDWCRHMHAVHVLDVLTADDGLPGTAAVMSYATDSVPSHHRRLEVVPTAGREDVESAYPCSSFVTDDRVLRGDELDRAQSAAAGVGHPSVHIDIAKLTTYEAELEWDRRVFGGRPRSRAICEVKGNPSWISEDMHRMKAAYALDVDLSSTGRRKLTRQRAKSDPSAGKK